MEENIDLMNVDIDSVEFNYRTRCCWAPPVIHLDLNSMLCPWCGETCTKLLRYPILEVTPIFWGLMD